MNEYTKCSFCYGTGYKVTTDGVETEMASGRITNEKCIGCNGRGYIVFEV